MSERFVGLVRVSTDAQGESGLGLASGLADLHAYVASVGGTLVEVIEEIESGGHSKAGDRPKLMQAIATCKRHRATLLVPKIDRLVRSTTAYTDIKRSRVKVRAADMPHAEEVMLDVLVAFAAHERRAISARTKAALAQYKAEGRVSKRVKALYPDGVPAEVKEATGGKLGAALVGCHLEASDRSKGGKRSALARSREAIDAYSELLPEIRARRDAGETLWGIAAALNSAGHRTRNGAEWASTTVLRVLRRG